MAIDPSIPLQARASIDPSRGIAQLANAIQIRRQNDQQAEINKQDKEDRALQNEATKLQIEQAKQKIAQSGKEEELKIWGRDLVIVKSLLDSDDIPAARSQLIQRKGLLVDKQAEDPSVNTFNTDELIQKIDQNDIEGLNQIINSELQGLQQVGLLKAPVTAKPLSEIGKARDDLARGLISKADFDGIIIKESGAKTPEQIAQVKELETFKAGLKKNEEEEALKLEKLQQDIDAKKLKIEEGEKQKQKAAGLKTTALRLVNDLLEDPDAVRSVVGPLDNSFFSPTVMKSSLRARTKIKQLTSIMTAENLGIMSGVLSESDIKIIAAIAGGGLDVDGSDEGFIEELGRLQTSLSNELGSNQTQEITPQGTAQIGRFTVKVK